MCVILDRLKRTLPFENNQDANRKRAAIWEEWDSNQFGFLSLSEIQSQLLDLLDLVDSPHLHLVIKKAYKTVRELSQRPSNYKQDVLEKRYFRVFVENFTILLQKMLIFEFLDSNKDDHISTDELVDIEKMFRRWNIDCQKLNLICEMSTKNQLTLEPFLDWMSNTLDSRANSIIDII